MKNLLLVSGLVFCGLAQASSWQLLYSKAYVFPFGVSVSDSVALPAPAKAMRLKVTYTGTNPCYIQAQRIDIHGPGYGVKALLPDAQGIFELPAVEVYQAVIHANSTKWAKVTCTESLYAEATAPHAENLTYLGNLTVEPMWDSAVFKLDLPAKITHFKIEVPAFCSDLAIDSADTMTEGVWDDAKEMHGDGWVYEVAGGVGTRISAIRLILHKAAAVSCPINFYGGIKP